ncbi:cytochrome P450 [Athelia psychrophila]|uniref:Cytochrome P450 n=1 Tax=Athelia psychrophila TaxID=1759441 RepID=A0A166JWA4_9AGAM|nr:cytochrome P450 [Fibularhizoctonia sp. CBS 109695]
MTLAGLLTLHSSLFTTRRFTKDKYPPGPPGLPFIGNLLQLSADPWIEFTEWKEQYGPIVYLNVAGQSIIVLNTTKAAADLLDRRADNYSDRPAFIVASDMLCGSLLLVFMRFDDLWKRMRRAAHEAMNADSMDDYHECQVKEAVILADGMLRNPNAWDDHIKRSATSTTMTLVYDYPSITTESSPVISRINGFVHRLTRAALPGAHFVEFFTWMKYLPEWTAKWKAYAMGWYRRDNVLFIELYDDVARRIAEGDDRPSITAHLARQGDKFGLNDKEKAWLAATDYAAGAETIAGTMAWFWLAITTHPEVQRKAQAELDEVVGRHRLPTFADYERLPYIRALVKETLRWQCVDPLGVPRRVMEDDVYEGYHIPKGAVCIPNIWAMNRDPEIYGVDASQFNPSRHLDGSGALRPAPVDTKEESHLTYGFGKRCRLTIIKRHIANNSLFINIATLLYTMTIEPSKVNPPDTTKYFNAGLVVRPMAFDCITRPRFPDVVEMLEGAKEDLA